MSIIMDPAQGIYVNGVLLSLTALSTIGDIQAQLDNKLSSNSSATPSVTNTYNLGTSALKWANIYSTNFIGTAASAQYADLAEKYTTDLDYVPGTILTISENEEYEMSECKSHQSPDGVVSTAPAYLMNSESTGLAIALTGRVPVLIYGSIKKGQYVKVLDGGIGTAAIDHNDGFIVGKALESNDTPSIKLVECKIKL